MGQLQIYPSLTDRLTVDALDPDFAPKVRVENQATVFDADFRAAGTDFTFKQDFGTCVAETHTSWMLNCEHPFLRILALPKAPYLDNKTTVTI